MATVISYVPTVFHSTAITQLTTTYSKHPHFCFFKQQLKKPTLLVATRVEATASSSSSSLTATTIEVNQADEKEVNTNTDILACPICYNQLIDIGDPGLTVKTIPGPSFQCNTCKKSYDSNDTYLDLTVAGGAKQYSEYIPPSTELFRTPLVSFLYERGWRQSFSIWGGFPGPDKEFELAKDYLKPVLGGNIIDASCGSGLFTRLFAKSGLFSLVVALDFSENMLRQSYEFIKQEDGIPDENLILVRADIARLPFVSSSVDAVHAGAALHCWPSPSSAVAEISRVLRPGGVFVATTYILDGIYGTVPLLKTLRQNIGRATSSHIFLSERELEDLCEACGLVNFTCARNGPFIMLSATKPC